MKGFRFELPHAARYGHRLTAQPRLVKRRHIKHFMGIAILLTLAACRPNYPVVSPGCYDLGKSLATICNLRESQHLPRLEKLARERQIQGQLSLEELDLLISIVREAEQGDWASAEDHAKSLLSAQTGDSRS